MKTLEEVQNEYGQLCASLGDCVARIADAERVKTEILAKIGEVQLEWAAHVAKAQADKAPGVIQ